MGEYIAITHYINPHLFWFKYVKSADVIDGRDIDIELNKLLENVQPDVHFEPSTCDRVAVKYLPLKLYIRAEVRSIVKTNQGKEYIVWATDHGFPIRTRADLMLPLPERIVDLPKCIVHRGGIANIVPALREMEPFTDTFNFKRQHNWTEYCCETLNQLLRSSGSIRFIENTQYKHADHLWGDLCIRTPTSDVQIASRFLIDKHMAMMCERTFRELHRITCTIKIPVWNTNNGQQNYRLNEWVDTMYPQFEQRSLDVNFEQVKRQMERVTQWIHCPVDPEDPAEGDQIVGNAKADVTMSSQTSDCRSLMEDEISSSFHSYSHSHSSRSKTSNKESDDQYADHVARLKLPNGRAAWMNKDYATYLEKSADEMYSRREASLDTTSEASSSLSLARRKLQQFKKSNERRPHERIPPTYQSEFSDHTRNSQEGDISRSMDSASVASTGPDSTTVDTILQRKLQKRNKTRSKKDSETNSEARTNSLCESFDGDSSLRESSKSISTTSLASSASFLQRKLRGFHKTLDGNDTASVKSTASESSNETVNTVEHSRSSSRRSQCVQNSVRGTATASAQNFDITADVADVETRRAQPLDIDPVTQAPVKHEEVEIESPFEAKKISSVTFMGKKMIPAGFDLSNLNKYNDQNHWHLRKSTRNRDNLEATRSSGYLTMNETTMNARFQSMNLSGDAGEIVEEEMDDPTGQGTGPEESFNDGESSFNAGESSLNAAESSFNAAESSLNAAESRSNFRLTGSKRDIHKKSSTGGESNTNTPTELATSPVRRPSATDSSGKATQIRHVSGEHAVKSMFGDTLLLAHANCHLPVADSLADVEFPPDIKAVMERRGLTKMLRSQSYAWPHLLHNKSMVLVNPRSSGKTWAYLAPLCSLLLVRGGDPGAEDTSYGPRAIVMVSSIAKAQRLYYLARDLLQRQPHLKIVMATGRQNFDDAKLSLLDGCALFVGTPAIVARMLEASKDESLIDFERLGHFVIDGLDAMEQRSFKDVQLVWQTLKKRLPQQGNGVLRAQLVLTSGYWHPGWMVPFIRSADYMLLGIGDFLEATVYGRVKFSLAAVLKDDKVARICDFIRRHPTQQESLIIFCNEDEEVQHVANSLCANGYVALGYHKMSSEAVRICVSEWIKRMGLGQPLVCSDSAFLKDVLRVTNVLHYSLPKTWTTFTRRFSAFSHSYRNRVVEGFKTVSEPEDDQKLCSHILLDEENCSKLPRLIEFLRLHQQEHVVPPEVHALCEQVALRLEEERIHRNFLICPYLLEFGKCQQTPCSFRHNMTSKDLINKEDDTPTSGDIQFHILKIYSPTFFSVRLLQHKPNDASRWQTLRSSNQASTFSLHLNMHYAKVDNRRPYWPLVNGGLCIFYDRDVAQRARVVDFAPHRTAVFCDIKVKIKLMDMGEVLDARSSQLYECAELFRHFPHQAMDVRLVGVAPQEGETEWDPETTSCVRQELHQAVTTTTVSGGRIHFAIRDVIWVNNVIVLEQLASTGFVYKLNLKRLLLEREYAVATDDDLAVKRIAEMYARLAAEQENDPETSGEDKSDGREDKSDAEEDKRDGEDKSDVGEDKETTRKRDEAVRAAVPQVTQIAATCQEGGNQPLAVKPREVCRQVPRDPSDSVARSSPETPKELWQGLPDDGKLVLVEIGDDEENGNWHDMYLQVVEDEQDAAQEELYKLCERHVAEVKMFRAESMPAGDWLRPLVHCVVRHRGNYMRAMLCSVYGRTRPRLFEFFLVDYAMFVRKGEDNLYDDFLYPSSRELVEFAPFQAVYCTLAGISLDSGYKRDYRVSKKFLFAKMVSSHEAPNPRRLPIPSFEVLFYESDEAYGGEAMESVNEKLVQIGFAEWTEAGRKLLNSRGVTPTDGGVPENRTFQYEGVQTVSIEQLMDCFRREILFEELEQGGRDFKVDDKTPKNGPSSAEKGATRQIKGDETVEKSINTKKKPTSKTKEPAKDKMSALFADTQAAKEQQVAKEPPPHTNEPRMPALVSLNKRPEVTWNETEFLITLTIHAPNIAEYCLEVTHDMLYFSAVINEEPNVVLLHFLGTVEPRKVSHEIRGLNVVVRLLKQYYIKWPRLLQQQNHKYPWLKYNYASLMGGDNGSGQRQAPIVRSSQGLQILAYDPSDDEDDAVCEAKVAAGSSDDESTPLMQTYTPTGNFDDDPTIS